jgi:hypothetical protein
MKTGAVLIRQPRHLVPGKKVEAPESRRQDDEQDGNTNGSQ